jgi:hypothetical protein
MKKLFFLFAFAFFAYAVQAQFGVKAGVNFANLGGDDADFEGKKVNVQLYGGVYYNYAFHDNFSIQPELVYSGQGAVSEVSSSKTKLNLAYLNFTPLLRYNTPSGFFVGLGPQIGFNISAKIKYDDDTEDDIKDDVKGTDFAGALALGYQLPNGFGFYARYNHSFTTIDKEDSDKLYNRVFSVGLRYSFGASKKGGEGGKSK